MRATGEHTAAVPVPAPPPPPTAEDAEKERRRRRRPARRPKQAAHPVVAAPQGPTHVDAAGPRSCRSMPPMDVGLRLLAEAESSAAGTSRSCPLLPTPFPVEAPVAGMGGGAAGRRFYQPHWPEQAVEEALKKGIAFMGKFRVNAHNRNEAYCTIDGIPVDVLITGAAQNRAIPSIAVAFGNYLSKSCLYYKHGCQSVARGGIATAPPCQSWLWRPPHGRGVPTASLRRCMASRTAEADARRRLERNKRRASGEKHEEHLDQLDV